jgi:hypothetical protein
MLASGALVGLRDAKSLAARDLKIALSTGQCPGHTTACHAQGGAVSTQLLQIGGWLGRWHWGGMCLRPARVLLDPGFHRIHSPQSDTQWNWQAATLRSVTGRGPPSSSANLAGCKLPTGKSPCHRASTAERPG